MILTNIINQIIKPTLNLLFAVAVIYFLWGVFNFVRHADDEAERKTGKDHIIYGLIGLTIMISANAIIAITVKSTTGNDIPANQQLLKIDKNN